MTLSSALLDEAVDQLATLPGVGRRTAMRLALDLMRRDTKEVVRFSEAIRRMREELQRCTVCCNISDGPQCAICADPRRDDGVICVVEDIRDVIAIEHTRQFRGKYHVLGGVISPMDNVGPEDLTGDELQHRAANGAVREVILALRATVEGDTTAFYIARRLGHTNVEITTIARGISVGGELDQADELTLGRSIADRKPYGQKVKE